MQADPHFYRVVAVARPKTVDDLSFVAVILKNMRGESKTEKIMFNNIFDAWEFYNAQQKMLIKSNGNCH